MSRSWLFSCQSLRSLIMLQLYIIIRWRGPEELSLSQTWTCHCRLCASKSNEQQQPSLSVQRSKGIWSIKCLWNRCRPCVLHQPCHTIASWHVSSSDLRTSSAAQRDDTYGKSASQTFWVPAKQVSSLDKDTLLRERSPSEAGYSDWSFCLSSNCPLCLPCCACGPWNRQ